MGHFEKGVWKKEPIERFIEASKEMAESIQECTGAMIEFHGTLEESGYFKQGRWISPFDALFAEPSEEPTFNVELTYDVPIFRQGAVIRWEQRHHIKTFTQSEMKSMLHSDGERMFFGPCSLPQVQP
jgi:hypothetical protein